MPGVQEPARQRGKQSGARGKNRRQVDNPDERIGVEPGACTGCGAGLADAVLVRILRRPVFEASPPTAGDLPYARAAALLQTLSGLPVSTRFLVNARRRAVILLGPFLARVRELLHGAELLHVDETTVRAVPR